MMKVLKILSNINALALAAYIPYILIDYNNFFFGKNKDDGVLAVSVIVFITTFICACVIFRTAYKRNVDNSLFLREIKSLSKVTLAVLICVYLPGIILMLLFVHSEAVIFYFAVSTISLIFVICEKVVIQKIDVSPYYKIILPWYFGTIPFVVFFGGSILVSYVVREAKQEPIILTLFVLAGIMMAYLAWHSCFIIDEKSKTLEKERGFLPQLASQRTVINFSNIKYVKKKGIFYILVCDNKSIKINRMYSGIKKFEKTLCDNGIVIE